MLWDFSIAKTCALLARTWPYLLLRAVVFGLSALIFVILAASGGILGHELLPAAFDDLQSPQAGILGLMGGIGLGAMVLRILREYTLYLVKGGHIAVMTQLLDHGDLPASQKQISFGAGQVRDRFAETSMLFVLDQMVSAALTSSRKALNNATMFLPGINVLFSFVHSVGEMAITYIDEIVLAHNFRVRSQNPWRTSADAVVLYAQNGKVMLKNAFWLTLLLMIVAVAILALSIGPFMVFFDDTAGPNQIYGAIAAGAMALCLLHIFLEPFAVCALMQVFFKVAHGQKPDPAWERRLEKVSPEFVQLRDYLDDVPNNLGAQSQ